MAAPERATARLRLRRVTMADLEAFVALESSLRAREDPPKEPPDVADAARRLDTYIAAWDTGPLGYWTVLFNHRIVGFGGVRANQWRRRRCWRLDYRVAPAYWGIGIATEVAREAVTAAGEVNPAWPVVVETSPHDIAAIRVAEHAGLRERELREDNLVLVREPAERDL